jgi:hypothetical protein
MLALGRGTKSTLSRILVAAALGAGVVCAAHAENDSGDVIWDNGKIGFRRETLPVPAALAFGVVAAAAGIIAARRRRGSGKDDDSSGK